MATAIMNRATVLCLRKKSRPRVFVVVCERCRYRRKCPSYQGYINPGLFEVTFKRNTERQHHA